MRKIYITLLIAILCGGCTSRRPADGEPLYVSILPLRSLVQGIVGDDFDIEVLVPPGASPETFEPTPRQFVGLNKARMVFNVGLIDFETMLLAKVEDQAKVVDLSRGIEQIDRHFARTAATAIRIRTASTRMSGHPAPGYDEKEYGNRKPYLVGRYYDVRTVVDDVRTVKYNET